MLNREILEDHGRKRMYMMVCRGVVVIDSFFFSLGLSCSDLWVSLWFYWVLALTPLCLCQWQHSCAQRDPAHPACTPSWPLGVGSTALNPGWNTHCLGTGNVLRLRHCWQCSQCPGQLGVHRGQVCACLKNAALLCDCVTLLGHSKFAALALILHWVIVGSLAQSACTSWTLARILYNLH